MDSQELQKSAVRVYRALARYGIRAGCQVGWGFSLALISSCSSLPKSDFKPYPFPVETAFVGDVNRPYQVIGTIRSKVNYQSLDVDHEEGELCRNSYNRAVGDMVKMAKEKGANAVIHVKSVVFYEGGQHESFPTPECSDDGMEGQVLTEGLAVKWK